MLKHCGRLLGIKCVIHGREKLLHDRACVVLMNHQSIIDLVGNTLFRSRFIYFIVTLFLIFCIFLCLVLGEVWPVLGKATMIAKKEIFYMWPFGLAVWLWGTIFIDRLSGDKAKATINKTASTIKERKVNKC